MLRAEVISYRHAGAAGKSLVDISLEVPAGRIIGIVGPSGAGLSSLCLVIAGLAPRVIGGTLSGRLVIDGLDVADWPMHRLVEFVVAGLQGSAGQLSMVAETVYEEIAFGPLNLGLGRDEVIERVEAALDRLAIRALATRDPRRLSGGEQQLVALAGLVAMRPRYLVLDEPLAHLDALAVDLVGGTLRGLAEAGTGILLAEQRTSALPAICDRLVAMDGGRTVAAGKPSDLLSDPDVLALGIREPEAMRLERLARVAGLELPSGPVPPAGGVGS